MRALVSAAVALAVLVSVLTGCKEGTLEPDLTGSLEGVVLDFETSEAIAGVSITTSPPTGAFVTDADGRFLLEDLETGNYTISARRPEYRANSVTVSVRDNRTTAATIFLEAENDDDDPSAAMQVDVTNWWNRTSGDSTFVNVEYRVRNTGQLTISAYEVYFRIRAGADNFYQEESGADLKVDQVNIRQFEKYIRSTPADSVQIEDTWLQEA